MAPDELPVGEMDTSRESPAMEPVSYTHLDVYKRQYYPVRSTAYKSLLDRAKISGSALPKLSRQRLASVLNDCLELYSSETLLLIRDEKISAAHSGDSMDYSVLPIDVYKRQFRSCSN